MAYGALASLMQTLDQILQPAPNHILLDRQLIESIKERVGFLLDFLEHSSTSKGAFDVLITQIRDAAYGSEDEIYVSVILPASESNKERNCRSFYKVLQQVLERMDSIKKEVMAKIEQGCSIKNLESKSSKPAGSSRLASSGKSSKVGLDKDLTQIKDRLCGFPSKREIVSITGMGGIGKTTLARSVYDDPFIVYHFYIRAWTTVSKQYCMREIFLGLLGSMKNLSDQMNRASDDQLGECLYKRLKGNRYLILMDDLWDTNVWDEVKRFFPDDNNGSRILITTRLSNVALYANSTGTYHQMHLLNETESWNLLREKVFGNECCHPELEEIGKKIARNCQGLPLAIVVIGGHLSNSSKTRDYWEHVAENVRSIVSTNDQCLEILSWSYSYLPHHLKASLLYFGAFPAAYEISVSKLIKLWAAEGFVKPLGTKSLEEAAETHLEDLVGRNLVLVRTYRFNGKIKTCSIHDLLRKICLREAEKEDFLRVMGSVDYLFRGRPLSQRRLSIASEMLDSYGNKYNPSVQSLLYFFGPSRRVLSFTANFRLLRVLDMLAVMLDVCPIEIVKLVTLRYLAFIYDGVLPESISKLCNLQTLIFCRGMGVTFVDILHLPMGIWKMPRLRHLQLNGSALPDPSGAQIDGGKSVLLEKLETLRVQDLRLSEAVLVMIPNLKKLTITYTPRSDQDISSYYLNNLVSFHQLETLKCVFVPQYSPAFSDATLNLVFPLNLKKLTLSGCAISWKNMTIVGSLPNLVALKLQIYAFQGPEWEANDGEFRLLQYLQLEMIDLKRWIADETHFPSLKRLSIRECFHLEEIPSGFKDVSTLELIEIDNSSESAAKSAMEILEEQRDLGNHDLQVRVHPTIYSRQDII